MTNDRPLNRGQGHGGQPPVPPSLGLDPFGWRYGQAHYGKSLFWHSSELLFAFFLTEQAGLPPVWMGVVLIAGLLSSASVDLLVGRALRRRAFTGERALRLQQIGAVASTCAITALFATDLLPAAARVPYALATALAFRVAYAFYDIAQNALLGLATSGAEARARLSSVRLAFSGLASITVALVLTALLLVGPDQRMGRFVIAAGLMGMVAIGTAWRLRDVPVQFTQAPDRPFAHLSGSVMPATLILLAMMLLASFAISTFTILEPYYVSTLGSGTSARGLMLAAAVGLTCSQIFWLKVVRRYSLHHALAVALVMLIASIGLFGMPWTSDTLRLGLGCLFGIANGGFGMAIWTAYADHVARRGQTGDPLAFALLPCAAKIGIALASGSVALGLSKGSVEALVPWGMVWPPVMALLAALFVLLAAKAAMPSDVCADQSVS